MEMIAMIRPKPGHSQSSLLMAAMPAIGASIAFIPAYQKALLRSVLRPSVLCNKANEDKAASSVPKEVGAFVRAKCYNPGITN